MWGGGSGTREAWPELQLQLRPGDESGGPRRMGRHAQKCRRTTQWSSTSPSECATQPLVCCSSTPPMMSLYPSSRRCRSQPWPTRKGKGEGAWPRDETRGRGREGRTVVTRRRRPDPGKEEWDPADDSEVEKGRMKAKRGRQSAPHHGRGLGRGAQGRDGGPAPGRQAGERQRPGVLQERRAAEGAPSQGGASEAGGGGGGGGGGGWRGGVGGGGVGRWPGDGEAGGGEHD